VIGARHEIRRATRADARALATMLARAFHDDPVMSWFFPDLKRRLAQNRRFFAMRLRQLLPQEETYTVDGHGAAAIWAIPERAHLTFLETARMSVVLAPAIGRRGPTILRGVEMIEKAHPTNPHYYLAVLGTEPELQGQGLGSALMQPVLDACDRDEVPAYLESSKERNIAFYARHGFRVTGEMNLPSGPTAWSMWRDPRP
jgi:ribosomal protein S18 acetylase RimI-like enzyme